MIYTLGMFFKSALLGFRSFFNDGLVGRALVVATEQQKIIREQSDIINRQNLYIQQVQLEHTRNVRNLVENFLIVQSDGVDVRDELIEGLRDLNDHVARLEEHSPSTSR